MRRLLCAALILGLASIAGASLTYQPPQDSPQPSGYNRFPDGIAIGDVQNTPGIGCMGWSEVDECFFIDGNCNYVLDRDLGERTMCECECCGGGGTCTDIGGGCTTNTECCTGICTDGFCATGGGGGGGCTDVEGACTSNTECCTGFCDPDTQLCAFHTATTSTTSTTTSSTTTTTLPDELPSMCFMVDGLRGEHDELFPWIAPEATTFVDVGCVCEGECVSPRAQIQLIDQDNDTISLDMGAGFLTCVTNATLTTWQALAPGDTDRTIPEGGRWGIRVTNSPASYDRVLICLR